MRQIANWPPAGQWLALVAGGLAAGYLLQRLHLPAGLMVGPLVIGAVLGMRGVTVRVPQRAHQLAQGIAVCLIALHIHPDVLPRAIALWPVIVIFVGLTFVAACATGVLAAVWTGIDREVSVWGFLPGMAGTVIAIAHERGLDSRMVAFIQILRLMVVIASMVAVATALSGPDGTPITGDVPADLRSTLLAAAIACLGVAAARWLPWLPAGASLVPLTLATGLSVSGFGLAMPLWMISAGFLGLGLQIGLRFTPDLVRTGIAAFPALLASSLLL
ncbi:MAG: AbrB family transcriptional regulator, partial [Paracoccaceae bacterium]